MEEANPVSIRNGIRSRLRREAASIGLNYTGGTKAMAVHAHHEVEAWTKVQAITFIASYLDAKSLVMVIEVNGELLRPATYVGRAIDPDLKSLFALHQRQADIFNQDAILHQTARRLAQLNQRANTARPWVQWKNELLHPLRTNEGWQRDSILRAAQVDFAGLQLPEISGSICQELGWPSSPSHTTIGDIADACGCLAEEICGWIDGKWLEHDVLNIVAEMQAALHLQDYARSVSPHTRGRTEFEVDVVALRGYQLFAFSCGTDSSHKTLKLKLFEAYVRTRQLGGDEARVALVCTNDRPEWLEGEMRRDIDPEGRIRVFGRPDLPILPEKLRRWIQQQSKEEV